MNGDAPQEGAPVERSARNGREDRAPRNEGRRERRRDEAPRAVEAASFLDSQPLDPAAADIAANEEGSDGAALSPRRDGEERRGRSRDRYGRDRRERSPREEGDTAATESAAAPVGIEADFAEPVVQAAERPAVPPSSTPIVVEAKAPASRALPKVQPFQLPIDELAQVAEGSGLHWVNSDADRVAEVRAAIAAEPKPLHVPRERPPAIVIDEGPLVLVETRRDLSATRLPFEQPLDDAGLRH